MPDETFAAKILGDGFAVVPTSGRVVAPVAGKITTVAQAKHAVGITTPAGVEVLVHIGVDTVQLAGSPFTMMVSEGQQVNAGDALVDVDWNVVKSAGKPTDVIVVFTNRPRSISCRSPPRVRWLPALRLAPSSPSDSVDTTTTNNKESSLIAGEDSFFF